MSDDRLIRALGELERDQVTSEDPRWEKLARGELSDEERALLEAEITAADGAAQAEDALAAHAPFDADELDALTRGALAAWDTPANERRGVVAVATPVVAPADVGGIAGVGPTVAEQPARDSVAREGAANDGADDDVAKVVPLAERRRSAKRHLVVVVLAAVAIAAAFLLFVRTPGPDLPRYTLAMASGDQSHRAAPTADAVTPRFAPGSTVDLVARPDRKVEGEVAARAFVRRGKALVPVAMSLPRSPDGAFRVRGTREVIFGDAADGPATIVVAIGAPAAVEAAANASDLTGSRLLLLEQDVELVP